MILAETIESLRIAIDALRSNTLRAILTMLGIIIGIAVVTLMGWALNSLDAAWNSTIELLGNDMLYVDKWDWAGGRNWRETMSRKNITIQEAEELQRRLRSAELVIPMASFWGRTLVVDDQKASGFTVTGVRAQYAQTAAGDVADGRFLTEAEDRFRQDVVVIGYGVKKAFFPQDDPLGRVLKIGGRRFVIIGVIAKRGSALMDFVDNQVFIPLNTFFAVYGTSSRPVSIAVKAGSPEKMEDVRSETIGTMRLVRGLRPEQDLDFSINETQAFRDQVAQIRLAIWGIGLYLTVMSFVVGMIGIMNVMFVSVTERTKEIGVRKAIGATRRSILLQFLLEAATLCLIGALAAIALCSILAAGIYFLFHEKAPFLTPYVPPQILAISITVSIVVGVLAGLLPALRAASMDPVEALRYE
ncbi:MAG: ABC transporter permease [Candidatus Kapaibacterium sp.]